MAPASGDFELIHALHARKAGSCALPLARELGVPCVLTLTGTDIADDIERTAEGAAVRATIAECDGLVALRASQLLELAEAGITIPEHSVVIPQGIEVAPPELGAAEALRRRRGIGPRDFMALLPGGLRPVKAQHIAIEATALVAHDGNPLHLVLAGPTLDPDYEQVLHTAARGVKWVHLTGPVPHSKISAAYTAADVVLNTSESEGESNALLEAQLVGRAVLARRNIGNSALVEHGVNGWLFDDAQELAALLQRARAAPEECAKLAARAEARVRERADPALEAASHLRLYLSLLGRSLLGVPMQ